MFKGKAVIVGAGAVGSTTAYTLMLSGLFKEIVLIDVNKDKAEGDALDMSHGVSLVKPVTVTAGDYSDCADADIIIITAGVPQKGTQTRLDLLKENVELFKKIIKSIRTPGEVRGSLDVVWKGATSAQLPKQEPEERIG